MDDNGLIPVLAERAVKGDRAALEDLLRQLQPAIVRSVRLIVGSGSRIAEDAAQEAMLDIARSIRSLRNPERVRVWAVRIASRRAIKAVRRERVAALVRAPRPVQVADVHDQSVVALKEAFDELPARLRATAVLRLYLGLSEAESAEALGCSTGTVKSNLHDARRRLAEALQERGVGPTISKLAKESRP